MNILVLSYANSLNFEVFFLKSINVQISHKNKCVHVSWYLL